MSSRLMRSVSRLPRLQPTIVLSTLQRGQHVRTLTTAIRASSPSITHSRHTAINRQVFVGGQKRFYSEGEKIVNVPSLADSITEGELSKWQVPIGGFVKQDEVVAVIETDKVDIEINAPNSGTVIETYAKEGDSVSVGSKLFKLKLGDASSAPAPAAKAEPAKQEVKPKAEPVKASEPAPTKKETPKPATAPITAAAPAPTPTPASAPAAQTTVASETVEPVRGDRRVKLNRLRLRIAERLKESQDTAASLTTFNEVDMKNLTDLRKEYNEQFLKKHGIKFGFMSAFLKASATALMEIPQVNASIDGQDIVYHDYVDISVAVATPKGLVTPVLRNVDRMSYLDIEKSLAELSTKARDGKITIEDMSGGTFTVSNGGVFGSLMGTPIINMPQSAILGMHAIKDRPIAVNGQVVIRPMMFIALTYDHRIIDGREAVSYLVRVKELVEDPRRLLLGL